MPKSITADTGMDVLTHAIESYVSVLASDYTDDLAMKAIQLVMQYLERSYNNSNDTVAREKMHNASCIAGLAFTNAFLGVCHSLAHKLGGEFHIAHGRANAILLPHVIRYNATKPTKFTIFPKYGEFIADQRYAEIARVAGLQGNTTEELVTALIEKIRDLNRTLGIPVSLKEARKDRMGNVVPVVITVYEDKSFDFQLKTTPAAIMLKKAAGIKSGSGNPRTTKVGKITVDQLREIAAYKLPDLNANDVEGAIDV